MVVVADPVTSGHVLLVGGLVGPTGKQATSSAVLSVDPSTGQGSQTGKLAVAVHDAAGAMLGGRVLIAGGGDPASTDVVQAYNPASATTTVVGHLPKARSDAAMAVAGDTAYIVGGYDGKTEDPDILATTDGTSFKVVAQLKTTVRYPAVVSSGSTLWVYGGEHNGKPVANVQKIDLASGTVTEAGSLPQPLAHEMSITLGGTDYLIGGYGKNPSNTVLAVDAQSGAVTAAGSMPWANGNAGAVAVGDTGYVIGGEAQDAEQQVIATPQIVELQQTQVASSAATAPAEQAAFNGKLLIADRGNNRLLLVGPDKQIHWQFPNADAPAPPTGFYFPDDAFFTHHGSGIISNQEGNDTIVEVTFPAGKPIWSYGHPGKPGTSDGYLNNPDDAYLLPDGRVVVADANNCRIAIISADQHLQKAIGAPGKCQHNPPSELGYPNGDTPLPNGNILISEVNGSWISEYTMDGALVWTRQLPSVRYVSDPQQLGPDDYLVADYSRPGGVTEFTREGKVLWDYHVASGEGMLDHPSLAEKLPNGDICVNDDYRHRVVIIDPSTNRIVWQYGLTDRAGSAPGLLNTPDGFDLLAPDGSTPTHPWTG